MSITAVLEHVRHRLSVHDYLSSAWRPVMETECGKRFVAGGGPRDWAVHQPARARCGSCYTTITHLRKARAIA
jgi:hypothetical protein